MTDRPNQYQTMVAHFAGDPGFAALVKANPALLVWDLAADTILWATPEADGLRNALADADGRVDVRLKARTRLHALANGLAPRSGMRLERLWLDPDRLAPPLMCACRLASLDDGRLVLVTAIIGTPPKGEETPRKTRAAEAPKEAAPTERPRHLEPAPSEAKPQRPLRFVWQADSHLRFTHVSPELAETVGAASGAILGKTWNEISGTLVHDPDKAVEALFAQRQTASRRIVFWSMDGGRQQIPVEWGGMPVFRPDRSLAGFRGFGLLRTDGIEDRVGLAMEPSSEPAVAESVDDEEPQGADENTSPPEQPDQWFALLQEQVAALIRDGNVQEPPPPPRHPSEQTETAHAPHIVPPAPPPSQAVDVPAPGLSVAERNAFREIARSLNARIDEKPAVESLVEPTPEPSPEPEAEAAPSAPELAQEEISAPARVEDILNRLPIGVIVHTDGRILFANRFLLVLAGYDSAGEIEADGGLSRLFKGSPLLAQRTDEEGPIALTTRRNGSIPVDLRPAEAAWDGEDANLLLVRRVAEPEAGQRLRAAEADLRVLDGRVRELESILDTATDGVIALDETGRILSLNRSAEALFGYDQREVVGDAITVLLAPESHIVALDYLEGLRSSGVASLLNDGREVLGRVRQGGAIPLFMTMGRVNESPERKFCAVLRDITAFKKAEGELVAAKRNAEEGSAQKSDLLAKISHEIRTPLNAIIGFAEVMLEERFGPIANERYKDYLKDVHASGAHVISLVNDLLDLAKIEAGRMELSFTGVNLNDLVSSCIAMFQPQASRDRIVLRTSFAAKLPSVVADERSVRQIVLNLVSNAIKFTDAGGQVILSTALTDRGEVAFRVRDTGIGMTDDEIETALEPFRQIATAHKRGGTGLGLPLTKALVEANRGTLQISSHPQEGTLVEVIFPPTRVLAE